MFEDLSFPGGSGVKNTRCQRRRLRGHQFNTRVGKIPWRRKWQPTPVFLPEKSHGQRSLAGYSPWSCKKSDVTEHACVSTKDFNGGNLGAVVQQWDSFRASTPSYHKDKSCTLDFPGSSRICRQCRRPRFDPWVAKIPWRRNSCLYSCLENPTDRGAWQATGLGVTRVGHSLVTEPPFHSESDSHSHSRAFRNPHSSVLWEKDLNLKAGRVHGWAQVESGQWWPPVRGSSPDQKVEPCRGCHSGKDPRLATWGPFVWLCLGLEAVKRT